MSSVASDTALRIRRHREEAPAPGRPFLLVLFGAFAAIMLVALLVGLQGYRAVADERSATDEQRLAYGSLVNTVKAFDAVDAFTVSEYEGNDVLSMAQLTNSGAYVMLLYVSDGMLMQQYSTADDAFVAPESAHALFATNTFDVAYANGLLTLTTDEVSPCVRLACPQSSLAFELDQRADAAGEAGDGR